MSIAMKLELVSDPPCPYAQRVAIMLAEKGVAYERRYVDVDQKPEWLAAISPRGKVPVLVADGVPLFESMPIVEFLDETHPPRLMPDDSFERARCRAWFEVGSDLIEWQRKLCFAATADQLASSRQGAGTVLGKFEEALGEGWLSDARFGVVEIAAAPALHRLVFVEQGTGARLLSAFPRVEAWARRIAARPSVAASVVPGFAERYLDVMRARGSWLTREPALA